MIGAGHTRQVGYKHRTDGLRDNTAYSLICGAFDLDAERGKDFGVRLGVDPARLYTYYKALIAGEAAREHGIEVVTVATPNFTHYEITRACLEAGLHVICNWANIHLWIAQAIDAKARGNEAFLARHHYPGLEGGTDGVRWLENCVRSADGGSV